MGLIILGTVSRSDLGLPEDWHRIWSWLESGGIPEAPQQDPPAAPKKKFPSLPILSSYKGVFDDSFWAQFPFNDLPTSIHSKIDVACLQGLIKESSRLMTVAELARADRAVSFLLKGAPSYQIRDLPQVFCRNDESAYQYGEMLTDTLAAWVSEGFLAGPFKSPPLPRFRVNPLKVVVKPDKVRPVLNVSSPIGASFNDNICEERMEKVVMSSAKKFSESILVAGKGSFLTKSDKKDAYKNIPCNLKDLRLQGLCWGGRYFVELYQIFGSRGAAANYDTLDNTTVTLARVQCSIPKPLVHRQLDDTPVVGPAHLDWCQQFTKTYSEICQKIGFKLAPDCPKLDKAFTLSKKGKILGIVFDTDKLAWSLPDDKRKDYLAALASAITEAQLSLVDAESLLGKLTFVVSVAPFMRVFKSNLMVLLSAMLESGNASLPLSAELLKDLRVWSAFLADSQAFLPIASPQMAPPLSHKTITTDAAGWKPDSGALIDAGIGVVAVSDSGELFFVSQTLWAFSEDAGLWDSSGKFLGCKTTSLELSGLVVAILQLGNELAGQHVVFQVDNIACHYIWSKGYSTSDRIASILARILVLLEAKLHMVLHVTHHPRLSSWESSLADRLSRARTTSASDRALLSRYRPPPFSVPSISGCSHLTRTGIYHLKS